jgi:hypothetical protein
MPADSTIRAADEARFARYYSSKVATVVRKKKATAAEKLPSSQLQNMAIDDAISTLPLGSLALAASAAC